MTIIHERLATVAQQLEEKHKLRRRLEHTQMALRQENARLGELRIRLNDESRDVERLEGLTLTNLFHTVLGNKEEAQEKERQEYLVAKLRYDEAQASVKALEAELADLETKLKTLGDPEADYRVALQEKEDYVFRSGGPVAQRLFELAEEEGRLKALDDELQEALLVGEEVEPALADVEDSLNSAHNWGVWDLLGGGLLVTAVKHSRVDEAREGIHRVQQLLRHFQRELADVQTGIESEMEIGGFTTFADYFFDGLIMDWVVQSKINTSLDTTRQQMAKVREVKHMLRQRLQGTRQRLEEVRALRLQEVENAR